jgi:acetylornithine deacetylase/succinyl-diaminopimelate desuccinylase-like protein
MPGTADPLVDELAELVAIPSVSADTARWDDVRAAGAWVRDRIERTGGTAELVATQTLPLLIGEIRASADAERAPTVLCYAHFDVQPAEPLELWESPPFALTARNGRLYGRGAADDKGNLLILCETAASLAAEGALPVNVRFAFDGEEESGGHAIVDWVAADRGPADVAVILDGGRITRDLPAFALATRGMLYFHVRVRTGATDMHSGMYGGVALNANHALLRALAPVLAGPDGRLPEPLRAGIAPVTDAERADWAQLPRGEEELSHYGAAPMDAGAVAEFHTRVFAEPSLEVNGIAGGSPDLVKTVLPVEARANVSIRLAPGQDPTAIAPAFERLVREAAPPGAELELTLRNSALPGHTPADSPAVALAADAFARGFGVRPLLVRSGGTLPVFAALVARGLPTVTTGFPVDAEASVHAPNENIPADALDVGVRTMREVLTAFADLR